MERRQQGETGPDVTQKERPQQANQATVGTRAKGAEAAPLSAGLAIALENVTPQGLDRLAGAEAPQSGPAPKVTASGRGAVAEQILQIAFERGVKVRKDGDLAEILSVVEVDSEIPLAALAGVAEILRYLYQTDAGARPASDPAAHPAVTPLQETRS